MTYSPSANFERFDPYRHAEYQRMQQQQNPSIGALFGQGLGQGLAQSLQGQMKEAVLDKVLNQVRPNMSALEKARLFGGAPEEAQPALQYYDQMQQQEQEQERAQTSEMQRREFEREKLALQHGYKMQQQEAKEAVKVKKGSPASFLPEEQKASVQSTFDRMSQILKEGNLGNPITTGGQFNRQRQEDSAEFNTLNIQLESIAKEMVSKGVLAKDRFKFMMDNLPHSNDSDRANKGKLKSIAKILGLDAGALSQEKSPQRKAPKMFSKLPNASTNSGRRIVNPETGEVLRSNGRSWEKE